MLRTTHRRRRTALSAAALAGAAGLALSLAGPAGAVTPVDWPASRVPVGCQPSAISETADGFDLTYVDDAAPTVTGWSYNGQTRRLLITPGPMDVSLTMGVVQGCSGVAGLLPIARASVNGGAPEFISVGSMGLLSGDPFTGTWGFEDTTSGSTETGWIQIPTMLTANRYSEFVLDQDFALVSKTASETTEVVTGPWSTQRLYLVLKTTQTTTQSKTSVARGGSVTFRTTVRKTGASSYVALAGVAVKFQTKLPGGSWVTRATRTTGSGGGASYTFAPGKTQAWRWVLAENITTSPYYAASTSAAKTIRVT